jgi:hypothetical protein
MSTLIFVTWYRWIMSENSANKRALSLVYHMEIVGFPKKDNIAHLQKLTQDLKDLAPRLSSTDQKTVGLIESTIQQISSVLEKQEEISISAFAILNKRIVLLHMSLLHAVA